FLPSLPTNYPSNIYPNFRPPHQLLINQSVVEKLLARDVVLFDTESQALRLCQSSAQFVPHRTVCSRIASLISSHQLLLKPFFRRCCDSKPHSYLDTTFPPTLRFFCFSLLVPSTLAPSSSSSYRPQRMPLNSITYYRSLMPPLPLPPLYRHLLRSGLAFGHLSALSLPVRCGIVLYI
ncbi:hypothetical protein, partial, partial [Parasitella parasitica]